MYNDEKIRAEKNRPVINYNNLDINLKNIYFFIKVAEFGNVSRAASRLYVSQPHLSKIIKGLEDRLGYKLFVRNKNKLILTGAGEETYRFFNTIVYPARERIERIKSAGRPGLDVCVQYDMDFMKIKDQGFVKSGFEKSKISIQYRNIFEIIDMLSNNMSDTAIVSDEYIDYFSGSDFEINIIGKADSFLLTKHGSPLSQKEYILPQELKGEKIIFNLEQNADNDIILKRCEKYCAEYGFDISDITFAVNRQTAILGAVMGEGVILTSSLNPQLTELVAVPVKGKSHNILSITSRRAALTKRNILDAFYNKME